MRRRALIAFALLALTRCELLTRSGEYSSYSGICTECSDAAGLKRPVCPSLSNRAADQGDDGQTYYFAWKTVSLGGNPFDGGESDVGYDEDCSLDTSRTARALCVANEVPNNDSRLIPSPPWTRLPGGIDNALGQRVVRPLQSLMSGFDVDAIISSALSDGKAGELVVIEDWNGTGDDNELTITFVGALGLDPSADGGAPRWDGSDVWLPRSPVAVYPHFKGYVSGGQLVADTRGVGDERLDVNLVDSAGQTHQFLIQARLMSRAGTLDKTHLSLTSYGRWDLPEAKQDADAIAAFLSGDPDPDGGLHHALADQLPGLFDGAADLPFTGSTPADLNGNVSAPCSAISLALKAEAYPVRVLHP